MSTFVDAVAAVVPAEVISAHALIIAAATQTRAGSGTVITNSGGLKLAFWALTALAPLLYLGIRWSSRKALQRLDLLRMLLPGAAFVLWTMLQRTTCFDAVAPHLSGSSRTIVAVLGALFVGGAAAVLGMKADQQSPPPLKAAPPSPGG